MALEWLDAHLQSVSVLWLFPIVFMFHDFEELLTVLILFLVWGRNRVAKSAHIR